MKKKTTAVIAAAALVFLAACGGGSGGVTVDPNAVTADYGDLYFSSNGCSFGIFDELEPVLEAIGEPPDTFEADSCAYQGKDIYYYYPGFELMINDIDGVMRITGITLTDDTVANPQGVRIGMDMDKALSLMNMEYDESSGVYSFTSGNALLRLRSDSDGCVDAIEYLAALETD